MYFSGILYNSVVDGEGIRNTVFISGCKHNCKGCHNKSTWSFKNGSEFTHEQQMKFISKCKQNPILQGITISGGDPIYSHTDVLEFIKLYKKHIPEHDIWLYTGFLFEDLHNLEILNYIDVLVDGEFELNKKDLSLKYRGSSNQRVIDVNKSLIENKLVLYKY